MKVAITLFFFLIASASSNAKDSLSLYIFLLDDCPICIQYTPTINELHNTYGEQISFVGIFPNFSSKQEKIDSFRTTYKIQFPLKTDYFKTLAKKYDATVTPEVVLFDHSNNKVLYQGRIDNKFYKLGKRRNVVTENNLAEAIQQILKGEEVKLPFIKPVGCFINYSDNFSKKIKVKID